MILPRAVILPNTLENSVYATTSIFYKSNGFSSRMKAFVITSSGRRSLIQNKNILFLMYNSRRTLHFQLYSVVLSKVHVSLVLDSAEYLFDHIHQS